ncbi:hypothetical protein MRY87_13040 [bacterium]|nr:hypothetical protein [bacterium]
MGEQVNPFLRAIGHLESSGVQYLIVGGFAVVMHGCNRFTPDMNVMVSFDDSERLQSFFSALTAADFVSTTDGDIELLKSVSHREELFDNGRRWFFPFRDLEAPSFSLDLFLHFPLPFEQLWEARLQLPYDGGQFAICSREHLIQLKELADRGQDKADIGSLALAQRIEEHQAAGKTEEEILDLSASDAEREQMEGLLRFHTLSPQQRLDWLAEMLNHLGMFCLS